MNISPQSVHSYDFERTNVVEAEAGPLLLQMIPSTVSAGGRYGREQEPQLLATLMHSLVLDANHPIALEIVGTPVERALLIRGRTAESLAHAERQLRARFPHLSFVSCPAHHDPFVVRDDELISAIELCPGGASYLPLQVFERLHGADDPLLGVLGALDGLPVGMRAIAQLALVPAPSTWSRKYQRKAMEHALEPERQQERQRIAAMRGSASAPSLVTLALGVLVFIGIELVKIDPRLLPAWLPALFSSLLHGHWQGLFSGPHHLQLWGGAGTILVGLVVLAFVRQVFARLGRSPLYDMRRVAEKTSRGACYVRLRCYAIGPKPVPTPRPAVSARPRESWKMMFQYVRAIAYGWLLTLWRGQWTLAWRSGRIIVISTVQHWWTAVLQVVHAGQAEGKRAWRYGEHILVARHQRAQVLSRLIAAYRQYHQESGSYFVPRVLSSRRAVQWANRGTWWRGIMRSHHLIDVESLAALWHAPPPGVLESLAHMRYEQGRTRFLPPALLLVARQEWQIGFSHHAGHRVPFGLPAECLERHMLIGGKSGEGKSTLMEHIALRAMLERRGLIVVDPHGDLAEHVLRLVPAERQDDVVFIDLSEQQFACGINPLDASIGKGSDKIVSDLIKIFSHIWQSTWGSRMEISFEYAIRTLFEANKWLCQQGREDEQYTLLDVTTVLTEESFCHALLEHVDDPFVLRWWYIYLDPLSMQMQRDRVDPVLSKVAKFESMIARHIMGQSQTTLDFSACIANEQIVLIKLAKGLVGEDVAHILGATLLGLIHIAFEEQGHAQAEQRKHLPILIDEFQTLAGVDWDILAELRKYGATFCLAAQSLDYLREKKMLSVMWANVKQLAIFRMSTDDAKAVARELDVEPEDILHLDSLTCYLKLMVGWRQYPSFSVSLSFPPKGDAQGAEAIRLACQRRYMRPTRDIEEKLKEHLVRQIAAAIAAKEAESAGRARSGKKPGLARQDGGDRGRKHQEQRTKEAGQTQKMNWQETVGDVQPYEGEQDGDPERETG